MTNQPVGPVLDALGMTVNLEPGHQITEAVVVGKAVNFNSAGEAELVISSSDGLDWISQLGLFAAARQVCDAEPPWTAD